MVSWAEGGLTDLNNLTLLCSYHHHNFLSKGWDCRINHQGLPEWLPPWYIDRNQNPDDQQPDPRRHGRHRTPTTLTHPEH